MRHRRNLSRSLAFLVAWLLYACGETPTGPPIAPEGDPVASAEVGPASESEAAELWTGRAVTDRLVSWALDPVETKTDHDARIARAILDLTDDRKERQP